jgi:hypothetical protein
MHRRTQLYSSSSSSIHYTRLNQLCGVACQLTPLHTLRVKRTPLHDNKLTLWHITGRTITNDAVEPLRRVTIH